MVVTVMLVTHFQTDPIFFGAFPNLCTSSNPLQQGHSIQHESLRGNQGWLSSSLIIIIGLISRYFIIM